MTSYLIFFICMMASIKTYLIGINSCKGHHRIPRYPAACYFDTRDWL